MLLFDSRALGRGCVPFRLIFAQVVHTQGQGVGKGLERLQNAHPRAGFDLAKVSLADPRLLSEKLLGQAACFIGAFSCLLALRTSMPTTLPASS
jgi:hypothetical protein